MYCVNCGSKAEEDQKFCASCGNNLEGNDLESNITEVHSDSNSNTAVAVRTTSVKSKVNKNRNAIIVGLIILAILIKMGVIDTSSVTGSLFTSKNKEPKAPVEKMLKGMIEGDSKVFLSAFHQGQIDAMREEYNRYYSDEYITFEHFINEQLAEMKYDIREEGLYSIKDMTIIQPPNHKNLMTTTVRILFKGDNREIDVIKIDGQWYMDEYMF